MLFCTRFMPFQSISRGVTKVTKELYSVKEAAGTLGVKPGWVYSRIKTGKIKVIKLGKLKKIKAGDLEKILQDGAE